MLMNSIMNQQPLRIDPIRFQPTGSVEQLGPEAYMTPQEKYLREKQARGSQLDQLSRQAQGHGQMNHAAGLPAGGVPGAGGGGAPPPAEGVAGLGAAMGGGGGQGGGMMQAIMKMLPMLMGG